MSPIRICTNWNKRESLSKEQIEPYRKYFFICEGEKTEYWYFKNLIDNRKNIGIHPLIDLRFMEKTDEDIYKGKSELFNKIIREVKDDDILAITCPSFELFLLLHFQDAFKTIIKPHEKLIYENKKIGKRRYLDKLFSDTANMNPKSNSKIGELVHRIGTAINSNSLTRNRSQ